MIQISTRGTEVNRDKHPASMKSRHRSALEMWGKGSNLQPQDIFSGANHDADILLSEQN